MQLISELRKKTSKFSTINFLGTSYPGTILSKSDTTLTRFLLETSLRAFRIDLENEILIKELVNLLTQEASLESMQNYISSKSQLSHELQLTLIAIAYRRHLATNKNDKNCIDDESMYRLHRLKTQYNFAKDEVPELLSKLAKPK
ncbi:hypothetical protein [Prochlorococcus sp. MIT 1341]|uniref:hypothetical protein n=1 Tax=Prochlorococcus sp. MIT 1341 TaxID=3096221 RepID=UPI002A7668AA|nr:hypothetical protein [Prochlorococcus sp. MIT 1341]